ncbi:MAG: response regulator [Rhodospirillales bacterium]|nr:response regulator [Rhodospirillales bacterium]MBO6785374.1 response regulator [Rhodospirillales bacterium]
MNETVSDEMPHVLVVDDDDRLRSLLAKYLGDNGFIVTAAADAAEARRRMTSIAFDLIVLDLMMPGESGLEFAEKVRVANDIPILMLTAMSESEDRIRGLEKGGDDYLTKPFEPRELVLRIHSILKRARPEPAQPQELFFGDAVFSLDRGEMRRRGRRVHLTEVEVALLRALGGTCGQVMSRERLIEATEAGGEGRAIDVQVTRLRRKIEKDPREPRFLKTVRGKGYVLWPDNR